MSERERLQPSPDVVRRPASHRVIDDVVTLLSPVRASTGRAALAVMLGLDGGGGAPPRDTAARTGVTRQRVDQVRVRITAHWNDARAEIPGIRSAIARVTALAPDDASAIEQRLVREGLLPPGFQLQGIEAAAELIGAKPSWSVAIVGAVRHVVVGSSRAAHHVLPAARRLAELFGLATVDDVAKSAAATSGGAIDNDAVRSLLGDASVRWLDDEHRWFAFDDIDGGISDRVGAALRLCGALDAPSLRAGLTRDPWRWPTAPPSRVLEALCNGLPGFDVHRREIAIHDPPHEPEIAVATVAFVAELRTRPEWTWDGALRLSGRLKIPRRSLTRALVHSPAIERLPAGIFRVRKGGTPNVTAWPLQPKALFAVPEIGPAWVAWRVTATIKRAGQAKLPELRKDLDPTIALYDPWGGALGVARIVGKAICGLDEVFARRGGEVGDMLAVVFNRGPGEATVLLGAPELVAWLHDGIAAMDEIAFTSGRLRGDRVKPTGRPHRRSPT
ncbi:MAG: hypothetical protein WCJ30_13510 [Deltaproteobacteria bacterium]